MLCLELRIGTGGMVSHHDILVYVWSKATHEILYLAIIYANYFRGVTPSPKIYSYMEYALKRYA